MKKLTTLITLILMASNIFASVIIPNIVQDPEILREEALIGNDLVKKRELAIKGVEISFEMFNREYMRLNKTEVPPLKPEIKDNMIKYLKEQATQELLSRTAEELRIFLQTVFAKEVDNSIREISTLENVIAKESGLPPRMPPLNIRLDDLENAIDVINKDKTKTIQSIKRIQTILSTKPTEPPKNFFEKNSELIMIALLFLFLVLTFLKK